MDWNGYAEKKQEEPNPFEDYFNRFMNDPGFFVKGLLALIVLILVIPLSPPDIRVWFTVKPEEQAVVTRLGRYIGTQLPGIHFKLPLLVDRVVLLRTEELRQQAFGFYLTERSATRESVFARTTRGMRQSSFTGGRNIDDESLMLTGDLNVADVNWVVQYKISNAHDYLFNLASPEKTIRDISQAAMRQVVGDMSINDVITTGRADVEDAARELTQKILSDYGVGVTIWALKLQDVTPPESVVPSFNEVNAALQEQKQAINRAEAYQNRLIPEARGKAEQMKSEARGYAEALVNRSRGDAERFGKMVTEYRAAPEVTRTRLYLELYENVLSRIERLTVVDPTIKGVLPLFSQSPPTTVAKVLDDDARGQNSSDSEMRR